MSLGYDEYISVLFWKCLIQVIQRMGIPHVRFFRSKSKQ